MAFFPTCISCFQLRTTPRGVFVPSPSRWSWGGCGGYAESSEDT